MIKYFFEYLEDKDYKYDLDIKDMILYIRQNLTIKELQELRKMIVVFGIGIKDIRVGKFV